VKRVFSSHNLQVAHHTRNLLEAEGIRAVVRNEMLSSAMGELPPAECQVEVWVVTDADFEKAAQILRSPRGRNEAPWQCDACGEAIEGQFTQCWRCGAYRRA
jgi:hypothetical protein